MIFIYQSSFVPAFVPYRDDVAFEARGKRVYFNAHMAIVFNTCNSEGHWLLNYHPQHLLHSIIAEKLKYDLPVY